MHISRQTGLGDLIFINGRHELKPEPEFDMFIRRMKRLQEIGEITDLAELPEYLSDEDPRVIEAAVIKLERFMDISNAR